MSVCLVTGGAGFIGGHMTRRLLDMGRKVRVLDDLSTGHRANLADVESDLEFIEGDIRDIPTVERAMRDVEVVFHFAARASVPRSVEQPRDAHDINVTGTFNLLLAARDVGARRFINSASSSAYGDTPTLPKIETMVPQPLSPYAASKLAAEAYCRSFCQVYDLETVSLRYFNVFGPRQDPNSQYAAVLPAFVSRMLRGQKPIVFGDGEHSRDFCYVENVVNANVLGMQADELHGEVVNIACGERTTLNEMIAQINAALGTQIEAEYQAPRVGDVKHSLASVEAAKNVLGYEPKIMFADGLPLAIEYYKSLAQ